MLLGLFRQPLIFIFLIPILLLSLSFHELAHAYISYRLGDPTAKNRGRLTLNPFKHLDILGTIMLVSSGFGWAKPVPINPLYYKNRKKGTMLVSLAGPLSNVLLAFLAAILLTLLEKRYGFARGNFYKPLSLNPILYDIGLLFFMVNIRLAVFNILPVPPLDGSKILGGILPSRYYFKLMEYEQYLGLFFLILIFVFPGILERVLSPIISILEVALNLLAALITGSPVFL